MSEIPSDLLFGEILSLLPARDLLRYRCVCKVWRDTIDHPSFIQTHLDRQTQSGVTQFILRGNGSKRFYSLSLQSSSDDADESKINVVEAKYLNHELFKNCFLSCELGNSCRGIMLVFVDSNKYLWNPFTGHHRKLPTLNNKRTIEVDQAPFGLGYDDDDDDYKVVRIDWYHDFNNVGSFITYYETYMYSLKLNAWRRIKSFPWKGFVSIGGVFLNGALHYISNRSTDSVVALHLGTEDYRVLPLPFAPDAKAIMYLGVLNGCLFFTLRDHLTMRWDAWLMKDYGVENSWVKISNIGGMKPLTYSKDREQILIHRVDDELHWLDLQTHSMTEVRISGSPMILSYKICVESLVRLDSDVRGVKRLRGNMIRKSK